MKKIIISLAGMVIGLGIAHCQPLTALDQKQVAWDVQDIQTQNTLMMQSWAAMNAHNAQIQADQADLNVYNSATVINEAQQADNNQQNNAPGNSLDVQGTIKQMGI